MSVYSVAAGGNTIYRNGNYFSGVVSIYNPNLDSTSKFTVRNANTTGLTSYYDVNREVNELSSGTTGVTVEKFAGTI